jgi:hypothetical protein
MVNIGWNINIFLNVFYQKLNNNYLVCIPLEFSGLKPGFPKLCSAERNRSAEYLRIFGLKFTVFPLKSQKARTVPYLKLKPFIVLID